MDGPERKSEAIEPGRIINVGTTSTVIFDAEALDEAFKAYLVNNSDTDITLTLGPSGAQPGSGIVLKAGGGAYDEDRYAGAISACHHGASGVKPLSVVVI